ncbi:hypothetical protein E1B28_003540 [Marasmius oreades]|uniref:Fungal-type protein kinase domain-containing protein n=1 Tax=Marasmius oreades TaxID=181124 RepID=A0A9P7RMR9_9AGAR|nr:uncharacterized protein E1B28_003540 [Marasmius oreades]KAG7086018.1 hypothetical protein E1B28_003540 [Marasmius oreades]
MTANGARHELREGSDERIFLREVWGNAGNFDKEVRCNLPRNDTFSRPRTRRVDRDNHYTIALVDVSHSLVKSRTAGGMLSAIADALKGHHGLYQHAHILHGYINVDTISIFEGTPPRGALKDWDMPLSKLLIDTTLENMEQLATGANGSEPDREDVMQHINAALATKNEESLSLLRERGISTKDEDIDRGEQLRRSLPQK